MIDEIEAMGRHSYGFGNWAAPYWFIGPEQGQSKDENHELSRRAKTWLELDADGLCDCRRFHDRIQIDKWHRDRPALQPTWRPLIFLLNEILGRSSDNETLRIYQRDRWGKEGDETCVIELSGHAANSFEIARDRTQHRLKRIDTIFNKLRTNNPSLVVMYSLSEQEHWEKIAGCSFQKVLIDERVAGFARLHFTQIVMTPHPTSFGLRKAYWSRLAQKVRQDIQIS